IRSAETKPPTPRPRQIAGGGVRPEIHPDPAPFLVAADQPADLPRLPHCLPPAYSDLRTRSCPLAASAGKQSDRAWIAESCAAKQSDLPLCAVAPALETGTRFPSQAPDAQAAPALGCALRSLPSSGKYRSLRFPEKPNRSLVNRRL